MKYISYYGICKASIRRNYVLSAVNKINYILNTITSLKYPVEVISASGSVETKGEFGKTINQSELIKIKFFPTLGQCNMMVRVLDRWITKLFMLLYLLSNIKKGENVIVYHSIGYLSLITFLKRIKNFRLILEVEEIYGDVYGSLSLTKRELKFFQLADAYIFPTELLDDRINIQHKPSVIIYGTYCVENKVNCSLFKEKNVKHILYAGTFDPRKGGAQTAVAIAPYLSKDYHIHILGFGSKKEVVSLQDLINETSKKSEATISYDGLLSGEEYTRFVQSCDIGLSTQIPEGIYNETSFPSKVLSYLANGLRVLSIRIKVLERSSINKLIFYYDENSPEAIAKVLKGINIEDNYDSLAAIRRLDEKFKFDMNFLLKNK